MSSKGRPFRTKTIDDFSILIGKGDVENDILTFEVADPEDFWLHVVDYAGSHVVIKNPNHLRVEDLPDNALRHAAELSAWHSKARDRRGKVEVHVCKAMHVSKPAGFPPGKVTLRHWSGIMVYPRDPTLEVGDEDS